MSPFMAMNVSSRSGTIRSAPAVPSGSSSQWKSSSISGRTAACVKYSWISSPRWLTQRSTLLTPARPRRPMMCSRIGRSPTGTSGLGMIVVYGRSLVPSPPARMTALTSTLRGVPVAGVEGIGELPGLERGDDLGDPIGDGLLRLEAQDLPNLVERDLVVARVLVAADVVDLSAARQLGLDLLDEVELAVVLARAAGVEDLAGDGVAGRVEHRAHGAAG